MKITDAEKKALKGRGYIMTRDGEHFVGRIITEDGVLTSEELMAAAADFSCFIVCGDRKDTATDSRK